MQTNRPIVAMIYDFDGTLAPGNMQEYDFLKEIGITDKAEFWREVVKMQQEQDAPEVLTYMRMMIEKSNNPENPRPITKQAFKKYGATIPLFTLHQLVRSDGNGRRFANRQGVQAYLCQPLHVRQGRSCRVACRGD